MVDDRELVEAAEQQQQVAAFLRPREAQVVAAVARRAARDERGVARRVVLLVRGVEAVREVLEEERAHLRPHAEVQRGDHGGAAVDQRGLRSIRNGTGGGCDAHDRVIPSNDLLEDVGRNTSENACR